MKESSILIVDDNPSILSALELDMGLSIVMITAFGNAELAVKAIRLGDTDFVLKPWDNEKMLATIESSCRLSHSRQNIRALVGMLSCTSKSGKTVFKIQWSSRVTRHASRFFGAATCTGCP